MYPDNNILNWKILKKKKPCKHCRNKFMPSRGCELMKKSFSLKFISLFFAIFWQHFLQMKLQYKFKSFNFQESSKLKKPFKCPKSNSNFCNNLKLKWIYNQWIIHNFQARRNLSIKCQIPILNSIFLEDPPWKSSKDIYLMKFYNRHSIEVFCRIKSQMIPA